MAVSGDKKRSEEDRDNDHMLSVVGELLFSLLPFVIIAIIFVYQNRSFYDFIIAPEWSFGMSVLFGQSMVRAVEAFVGFRGDIVSERVGFSMALILVGGLMPSLTFLTLLLITPAPPLWLDIAQIVMFLLSLGTFFLFNVVARKMVEEAKENSKVTN